MGANKKPPRKNRWHHHRDPYTMLQDSSSSGRKLNGIQNIRNSTNRGKSSQLRDWRTKVCREDTSQNRVPLFAGASGRLFQVLQSKYAQNMHVTEFLEFVMFMEPPRFGSKNIRTAPRFQSITPRTAVLEVPLRGLGVGCISRAARWPTRDFSHYFE